MRKQGNIKKRKLNGPVLETGKKLTIQSRKECLKLPRKR